MSKSLARVTKALHDGGVESTPLEMPDETRTAEQAAAAAGCGLDQIVKSILFQGASGRLYLFLTAGGHQVDPSLASALAGEPLDRADGRRVRDVTGFAIGGVAPIGHPAPLRTIVDIDLANFDEVWAAGGHPHYVFPTSFAELVRITGGTPADVGA